MTRDGVTARFVRIVPWLWLALTLSWGVIIAVTNRPAWELALWIAATLGPLTSLDPGS